MTLDPESRRLVAAVRATGMKPMYELTPQQAREQLGALRPAVAESAWAGRTDDVDYVATDGSVLGLRLLTPPGTPRALTVYLHGGGWVLGDLDGYEALARDFAERADSVVVMVGYRLAPEFPYPTALGDVLDAVRFVHGCGREIVGCAGDVPLVLFGDSAGGNLAAAASLCLMATGGPSVAMQLLAYPVTDCDFSRPSYLQSANQLILDAPTMQWFWDQYVPEPARRTEELVSVLRASDLRGLPPTVVLTAEHDVLRDEGEAYAARLDEAGVAVVLRRFTGQLHGFLSYPHALAAGGEAMQWLADQLVGIGRG